MFTTKLGRATIPIAESVARQIENTQSASIESRQLKRDRFAKAIGEFNSLLAKLPTQQQHAALEVFYSEASNLIQGFKLSLLIATVRREIDDAACKEEAHTAIKRFRTEADSLGVTMFDFGL